MEVISKVERTAVRRSLHRRVRCCGLHHMARESKMALVDAIAEKLDTKLSKWKPEISQEVRALVLQVIDAADNDALDLVHSRAVEQEVLDQLDEPVSR